MLTAALLGAAVAAGVAGTWSPCGLSSVDTIGGAAAPAWVRWLACVFFAIGAVAGGIATFATLSTVGGVLGGGGRAALAAAAVIAAAAAVADARGARVTPQIRRQVPEPWRRAVPLPLAALTYGFLLGLGFTTFVLSFALWAIAAIAATLGDVQLGVALGVAFGLGRALPVVVLAPLARGPIGMRITGSIMERPVILRGWRAFGAVMLVGAAFSLASQASAATRIGQGARDPTVSADRVAWETAKGITLVRERSIGERVFILGRDPALGGSLLAYRKGSEVRVLRVSDYATVAVFDLPGVDALAVSERWLVYRRRGLTGGDELLVRPLDGSGGDRVLAAARAPAQLGRPVIDGDRIVFHVALLRESRIVEVDLAAQRRRILRRSRADQLSNPSILGSALLYVRRSETRQRLVLGTTPARERVLYATPSAARRDRGSEPGHSPFTITPRVRRARFAFWTTALSERYAYLTLVPGEGRRGAPVLVRIPR